MTLEQVYGVAAERGIEIDIVQMKALRAVAFPDGWIAIDRQKFANDIEYKCVLAHEIGHCETNSFYNIHTSVPVKEINERQANRFAAELLVPFSRLRHAIHELGILIPRILAKMFDVTLDFIAMVLDLYEQELAAPSCRRCSWAPTTCSIERGHTYHGIPGIRISTS